MKEREIGEERTHECECECEWVIGNAKNEKSFDAVILVSFCFTKSLTNSKKHSQTHNQRSRNSLNVYRIICRVFIVDDASHAKDEKNTALFKNVQYHIQYTRLNGHLKGTDWRQHVTNVSWRTPWMTFWSCARPNFAMYSPSDFFWIFFFASILFFNTCLVTCCFQSMPVK